MRVNTSNGIGSRSSTLLASGTGTREQYPAAMIVFQNVASIPFAGSASASRQVCVREGIELHIPPGKNLYTGFIFNGLPSKLYWLLAKARNY